MSFHGRLDQSSLAPSRRQLLGGVAGAAGAVALGAAPTATAAGTASSGTALATGARIVLLGTNGGPVPSAVSQTASALVVDDAVYLIDAGLGMPRQFYLAGLDFTQVRAQFITHLHSDHMTDFYAFYQLNWAAQQFEVQPVKVFGPGRADENAPRGRGVPGLPDLLDTPLVNPRLPTPGIVEIAGFHEQAAAYDINERLRDYWPEGEPGPAGRVPPLLDVGAIRLPAHVNFRNPYPLITPIPVYEDDKVSVTATLVNHWPIFPSFAFRFETAYGSVVFSGDTSPVPNLFRIAAGADYLVNEVLYMPNLYKDPGTEIWGLDWHLLMAHTQLIDVPAIQNIPAHAGVGTLARQSGVGTLVLNHLVPSGGQIPDATWIDGVRSGGFTGPVFVGSDLLSIPVTKS